MSFKDRFKKSNPRHDKPPQERPIIKARVRPDLYEPSWGDYTLSKPGIGSASSTTISSTGSQTYTVPRGVDTITITMYGGGGGGGKAVSAGRGGGTTNGGGGGGGGRIVVTLNEVAPGTVLTFSVGAGGAKGTGSGNNGSDGGNTTLSYGGVDYVAGGGEGSAGGECLSSCKDGTGGVSDCDSGSNCAATSGNNGTAKNSTAAAGAALGDSAGAGGAGSTSTSSQNHADGGNGKVLIS